MELEYFQIREDDTEILKQIKETCLGITADNYDAVMFARYNRVYACVEGDTLVGCCIFVRDFAEQDKAFFYGVNMLRKDRNVMRKLIEISLNDLKESGIAKVEVFVDPENFRAVQVYRDVYGFEIKKAEDGEPEVGEYTVMVKAL